MRTCEQGRTSLVRVFAENPGITPGSGFQPPHSRLQRKKDNRGLRPWGTLYFLAAKSTKNSPADAFAYFVPANVRNGRLFAGLQANRPRFLPLLAGPSFHSFGIGPESFAAKRGGEEAQQQDRKRSILPSPLKAVLNRRILAWSGIRTTASPRVRTARRQAIRKKNLALRPSCTIFVFIL